MVVVSAERSAYLFLGNGLIKAVLNARERESHWLHSSPCLFTSCIHNSVKYNSDTAVPNSKYVVNLLAPELFF